MYSFASDPSGILLIEITGFWTIQTADSYLAELRAQIMQVRRRKGYSLVMVDGRQSQIQTAEVMERMGDIQAILVESARDRAAYIVTNSLAKLQAQRLSTTDRLKVFLSPSAARTWLLAYEDAAPAAG